jgi:Ca2+-binding RTX toxin-like protein
MTTELGFARAFADPRAGLPRIWFESLERRRLFSYSYTFDDGLLVIRGTAGPDDINVHVDPWSQGYPKWGRAVGAGLAIAGTGITYNLERNLIREIRIEGGGGNDVISIVDRSNGYDLSITVLGGAGDDTIRGAGWSELLDGQAGNDSIEGGGGADVLPDDPWEEPDDPAVMLNRRGEFEARAEVIDGVLHVSTGDDVDDIMLGTEHGNGEEIYVSVNGMRRKFSRAGLAGVVIDAQGGGDFFSFHNFVKIVDLPVTVIGGAGNDELYGQHDRDAVDGLLDGGVPPSTLIGGEGDDIVYSGLGGGVIDGGGGADDLRVRGEAPVTVLDEPIEPLELTEPAGPWGGGEEVEVDVEELPVDVSEETPAAEDSDVVIAPPAAAAAADTNGAGLFEDGASILGSAEDELLG